MCKKKALVVHVTTAGGNRKTTGADTPMALSALSCEFKGRFAYYIYIQYPST
jgi:hypothetical protein